MDLERRYAPIEFRADGRGLSGVVMRYGDVAELPFGLERFEPRAFGDVAAADIILNVQHDRSRVLARTGGGGLTLKDDGSALSMRAELLGTRDGEDALINVKARILRGLSVEFAARRERMIGDLRVIERAELRGIALVDRPAYNATMVAARARQSVSPARRLWL